MHYRSKGAGITKKKIVAVWGEDLFNNLKDIEDEILLDRILFGYFDRCFTLNEVLVKYNFFLKFFERPDIYRFLIKKKGQGKNGLTRNLCSCVLEKSNGHEMKEKNICRKEKSDFIPINIVYEPRYDESIPVLATLLARFI